MDGAEDGSGLSHGAGQNDPLVAPLVAEQRLRGAVCTQTEQSALRRTKAEKE